MNISRDSALILDITIQYAEQVAKKVPLPSISKNLKSKFSQNVELVHKVMVQLAELREPKTSSDENVVTISKRILDTEEIETLGVVNYNKMLSLVNAKLISQTQFSELVRTYLDLKEFAIVSFEEFMVLSVFSYSDSDNRFRRYNIKFDDTVH